MLRAVLDQSLPRRHDLMPGGIDGLAASVQPLPAWNALFQFGLFRLAAQIGQH